VVESLSIYFFAGDFAEVLRRQADGEPQVYGTHTEVAKLIHELADAGVETTIYSFCTPAAREEHPLDKVRIISLGAQSYREGALLTRAVGEDRSDAIIAHFPSLQLLRAVADTRRPAMAFLASSFFRRGVRPWWRTRRTVALLNRPEYEFISNHCRPATEHLADLGVRREKLIPWDVPHPFTPADSAPKMRAPIAPFTVMYTGAITEEKGVGDVVRAIPHLRSAADIRFVFAGRGEIDAMTCLAKRLDVERKVEFLGAIPNPDVFDRFKAADLLVVPSRHEFQEGFPLTMFESIASFTPIVCSDHPIFCRVLTDRTNAMLYRAGDERQLATAIDAVLADPDLYLGLSNAGPETWRRLQGPANWRRLILEWVQNGVGSPYIQGHLLGQQH
jgi:glycosyltransferase involved in cell wall biosynthesis